jgi:DNA-binding transcriptional MerR regulator
LIIDKASERVDVELQWIGGRVESHVLSRPVRRYDLRADYPRLIARLRGLCAEGLSAAGIAERLNEEGFRPPKRVDRFNRGMVQRLLCRVELAHRKPHGSRSNPGQDEYRPGGLARRLEIALDTVRRWIRAGWLTSSRDAEGQGQRALIGSPGKL